MGLGYRAARGMYRMTKSYGRTVGKMYFGTGYKRQYRSSGTRSSSSSGGGGDYQAPWSYAETRRVMMDSIIRVAADHGTSHAETIAEATATNTYNRGVIQRYELDRLTGPGITAEQRQWWKQQDAWRAGQQRQARAEAISAIAQGWVQGSLTRTRVTAFVNQHNVTDEELIDALEAASN